MCCRTRVLPYEPEIAAAMLAVGLFQVTGKDTWRRLVPEEETHVSAYAAFDGLVFSLSPAVSSLEGHHHKRIAASIMYEMAVRISEKIGGVIQQEGINVPACMEAGHSVRVLASYPSKPLDYGNLCLGWRGVFLSEVE